ncbi:MAG: ABC transporter substrate-binding protein [Anaerolineae bacterium]|nr:ABC transporter substrate-binding protein [Anaerolineae bacterium]
MLSNDHSQDKAQNSWMFLVGTVVLSLLLTACGGGQKTYTIGVINIVPDLDNTLAGFKEGMTELGYIEGENVTYLYEGVTVDMDKLDSVAQGMVAADVDLILSITTPATQAAQRATADIDIPVVFVPVTDPVGAGLVSSLKQPGGNITGVTFGIQEGRRLEWLVQIVPTIEQIYVPYNPEDRSAVLALEMASATATKLDVELITREVHSPEQVMDAIEHVPEEADAIFFLPDSLVSARMSDHIKTAVELRLPTSGANTEAVKDGLLTSYGMEQTSSGKQAARLADQIFQGIKPADLPVETAEFYLAINLKTAEAIGLDISDEILLQADIIIH